MEYFGLLLYLICMLHETAVKLRAATVSKSIAAIATVKLSTKNRQIPAIKNSEQILTDSWNLWPNNRRNFKRWTA